MAIPMKPTNIVASAKVSCLLIILNLQVIRGFLSADFRIICHTFLYIIENTYQRVHENLLDGQITRGLPESAILFLM